MSEVDEIALLFDPPWKDFNESSNNVTFAIFRASLLTFRTVEQKQNSDKDSLKVAYLAISF